jgi:hypothetical protein
MYKCSLEPLTGKQVTDVKLTLSPQSAALDDHAVLEQVGIQEDTGIHFSPNYPSYLHGMLIIDVHLKVYWIPAEDKFEASNVPLYEQEEESEGKGKAVEK